MSHLRSFLVAWLCAVSLSAGCGRSSRPVAQANNIVQQEGAGGGGGTHLGTADYQPHAAAGQGSFTAPAPVSPPSASFQPGTVAPPAVAPFGSSQGSPPAAAPVDPGMPNQPIAPPSVPPSDTGVPPAEDLPSTFSGSAPGELASGDTRGLATAIAQWRLQGNLVGVKRFDDKPVIAGNSWMIQLLPYVGHSDLHAQFDLTKGWHEKENLPYACEVIPAFLDPGNSNHSAKVIGRRNAIGPAFTHFVGMAGIEDSRNVVAASLPRSDPRAGIFGYDQIARPEEITDGATNTIMLISAGKIVGAWAAGGGSTIRGARAPYFDSISGFGTAHDPGSGALVAMADGSVKRISKDIDPAVFRALCTIHGGETVDLSTNASIRPE